MTTPALRLFSALISLWLLISIGCHNASPTGTPQAAMLANPASVKCAEVGGNLRIEKNAGGGEYGVCSFRGGGECEEWALFRGHCPVGGTEVPTDMGARARYCMIRGGRYKEGRCGLQKPGPPTSE